ncbi:MAG: 3D domain-containing protein [Candidatus Hydrogenedentes bacterium]|nr:3D domain-containing protein [Candidatus Hydrogenedentota bacterium]
MSGIPRKLALFVGLMMGALVSAGCASTGNQMPPADMMKPMEITAYCPCKKCCGWHRTWLGRPVTQAGHRKKVGVTASGEKAKPGTIAADTSKYPFGTVMYVPGYGYGTVQDRGGAIKGERIDLFFKSHQDALEWGRVKAEVFVWMPSANVANR